MTRSHLTTEVEKIQALRTVTDPAILRSLAELHREFGRYAMSAEATQELVATEMRENGWADRTLTDILLEMRRERP